MATATIEPTITDTKTIGENRPAFTPADKAKFSVDIAHEKKKLFLRAPTKPAMLELLNTEEFEGELKYAPLRIAVNDARVWASPDVALPF